MRAPMAVIALMSFVAAATLVDLARAQTPAGAFKPAGAVKQAPSLRRPEGRSSSLYRQRRRPRQRPHSMSDRARKWGCNTICKSLIVIASAAKQSRVRAVDSGSLCRLRLLAMTRRLRLASSSCRSARRNAD